MTRFSEHILLGAVLERQGPRVLRNAAAGGNHDFVRAVRRCGRCKAYARCRAWLESGAQEGYQEFCPNAGYVERMTTIAG